MRLSRPTALLIAVSVLAGVLGAGLTLARETLGLGGGNPTAFQASMATLLLLVVCVLMATLLGLRGGQNASTPYW